MIEKLLTPEQVCEKLGIKRKTLSNWISLKKMATVHLSRRAVRFREKDVQALIDAGYRPADPIHVIRERIN